MEEGRVYSGCKSFYGFAAKPCLLGRTEVSNLQFSQFLAATGGARSKPLLGDAWLAKELPVTGISWAQAAL